MERKNKRVERSPKQAAVDRKEAVRLLDTVRRRIGRLEGPSIAEDLRRDRSRDER
jgi:hypothetical protein